MRRMLSLGLALSFALFAGPAAAQSMEIYERMAAAMETAQAEAVRPGDEMLTCEQLESEAFSVAQDPAVQAMAVRSGAYSQAQIDEANRAASSARRQMGVSMFLGLASAFVPGAGMAASLGQRAQGAMMQRQAQQNLAQSMAMAEQMIPVMPQLMRGQRVYELAQGKQCAFIQQTAAEAQP